MIPLHLGLEKDHTEKWNRLGHGIGVAYQIKDDFEDAGKGREINYALLKASQHFGGSPFEASTKTNWKLCAAPRWQIWTLAVRA